MEFGAEDSSVRTTLSEELLRYARARLLSGEDAPFTPPLPTDAEGVIRLVLQGI